MRQDIILFELNRIPGLICRKRVIIAGGCILAVNLDGSRVDFQTGSRLVANDERGMQGVVRIVRDCGRHLEGNDVANLVEIGLVLKIRANTLRHLHRSLLSGNLHLISGVIGAIGLGLGGHVDDHILVHASIAAGAGHAHQVIAAAQIERCGGPGCSRFARICAGCDCGSNLACGLLHIRALREGVAVRRDSGQTINGVVRLRNSRVELVAQIVGGVDIRVGDEKRLDLVAIKQPIDGYLSILHISVARRRCHCHCGRHSECHCRCHHDRHRLFAYHSLHILLHELLLSQSHCQCAISLCSPALAG